MNNKSKPEKKLSTDFQFDWLTDIQKVGNEQNKLIKSIATSLERIAFFHPNPEDVLARMQKEESFLTEKNMRVRYLLSELIDDFAYRNESRESVVDRLKKIRDFLSASKNEALTA